MRDGLSERDLVRVDAARASNAQIYALRLKTAMVFQNYNLLKNMTALENVTSGVAFGEGLAQRPDELPLADSRTTDRKSVV